MTKFERLIHRGDVQLVDKKGVVIGKLAPNLPSDAMMKTLKELKETLQ